MSEGKRTQVGEERGWIRDLPRTKLEALILPWHAEGFELAANRKPKLIGAACGTRLRDAEQVERRPAADPPLEARRCPTCQAAYAQGIASL